MKKNEKKFIPLRSGDDYRLPNALLSAEEYISAVEMLGEAVKKPSDTFAKTNERSRYYELYSFLKKIYDEKQLNPETKERCVLCGEPVHDEKHPEQDGPLCHRCEIKLHSNRISNTQNSRGFRNWGRICIVCNDKPAYPNFNGLCRACYRLGDNLNNHDPDFIRAYRQSRGAQKLVRGEPTAKTDLTRLINEKGRIEF